MCSTTDWVGSALQSVMALLFAVPGVRKKSARLTPFRVSLQMIRGPRSNVTHTRRYDAEIDSRDREIIECHSA